MIEKISVIKNLTKKLELIEHDVKELKQKQSKEFVELKSRLTEIKNNLNELAESKISYIEQLSHGLDSVKNIEKEFTALMRTFKQNHKQLYDYAYKQLNSEIKMQFLPLRKIVEDFNKLKPLIEGLNKNFNQVKVETEKLITISSSLKKEDFELKAYAKELLKMDSEKLKLMKQIDTLKKVIAHERRQRR